MLVAKKQEIEKKRKEKGYSQRKLSSVAGLPINAICRLEKNDYSFTHPIRAKAIARALGCKITEIFEENERR